MISYLAAATQKNLTQYVFGLKTDSLCGALICSYLSDNDCGVVLSGQYIYNVTISCTQTALCYMQVSTLQCCPMKNYNSGCTDHILKS